MEIQQHIKNVFGIDVVQTITLFWERFYPTNHTERLATSMAKSKDIFS